MKKRGLLLCAGAREVVFGSRQKSVWFAAKECLVRRKRVAY